MPSSSKQTNLSQSQMQTIQSINKTIQTYSKQNPPWISLDKKEHYRNILKGLIAKGAGGSEDDEVLQRLQKRLGKVKDKMSKQVKSQSRSTSQSQQNLDESVNFHKKIKETSAKSFNSDIVINSKEQMQMKDREKSINLQKNTSKSTSELNSKSKSKLGFELDARGGSSKNAIVASSSNSASVSDPLHSPNIIIRAKKQLSRSKIESKPKSISMALSNPKSAVAYPTPAPQRHRDRHHDHSDITSTNHNAIHDNPDISNAVSMANNSISCAISETAEDEVDANANVSVASANLNASTTRSDNVNMTTGSNKNNSRRGSRNENSVGSEIEIEVSNDVIDHANHESLVLRSLSAKKNIEDSYSRECNCDTKYGPILDPSVPTYNEHSEHFLDRDTLQRLFVEMCVFGRMKYVQPVSCIQCVLANENDIGNGKDNDKDENNNPKSSSRNQCQNWVVWRKNASEECTTRHNTNINTGTNTANSFHPEALEGNLLFVTCATAQAWLRKETVGGMEWDEQGKVLRDADPLL